MLYEWGVIKSTGILKQHYAAIALFLLSQYLNQSSLALTTRSASIG
ncbi:MAG: hypothetical protein RLZZ419_302, partial [Pseudomonadota bacterium]